MLLAVKVWRLGNSMQTNRTSLIRNRPGRGGGGFEWRPHTAALKKDMPYAYLGIQDVLSLAGRTASNSHVLHALFCPHLTPSCQTCNLPQRDYCDRIQLGFKTSSYEG